MLDAIVIVVGGGPAGAAAAKRCAQSGLRTILLEKKKLPREKVCGGALLPAAWRLIREEFGELPAGVLNDPDYLSGFTIHVPGAAPQKVDVQIPQAWRKDLDHWLELRAVRAGVVIRDGVAVTGIREESGSYRVDVTIDGKAGVLEARFVVGADGAESAVRKSLYPNIDPVYGEAFREYYRGDSGLGRDRVHLFFSPGTGLYLMSVIHKGDHFLVQWGARVGQAKMLRDAWWEILARNHGFDPKRTPVWKDTCLEPSLYRDLFSGAFMPARGNVLLAGDAAGLMIPVTGDGISPALLSGHLAASAIIKAEETGKKAEESYTPAVREMISRIRTFYPLCNRIVEQAKTGGQAYSNAVRTCWEGSLSLFDAD